MSYSYIYICPVIFKDFLNVKNQVYWQKLFRYELRLQETPGTISRSVEEAQTKTKKIGRITGNIHPTEGDLVLIRNDGKQDYDRYGVVEKILSPQTIRIRTRNGTIERPISITVPISAKCLSLEFRVLLA